MSKTNGKNELLRSRMQFIKDHFGSPPPSDDSFTSNFIKSLNSIEQFYLAYSYNLKKSYDVACLIIDNPLCDKATASDIFWVFEPEDYLFTPDKVPGGSKKKKHFELLQKIIHKFKNNEFKHQQIEYDPRSSHGYENGYEKLKECKLENWKLPPELTKPIEGLPIAIVQDVNEILKSRAKLIEKHFAFPPPYNASFVPNYELVKSLNSIEQFYLADNYNYEYGTEILYSIIDSPLCDKATASSIFWFLCPGSYIFTPDNVPDGHQKDFFDFFQKVIRKFKNNEFKYQQIEYDPRLGYGYKNGYEKLKESKLENWKLPPELTEPIKGKVIVIEDDGYIPSNEELIDEHFFEYSQEYEDKLDFELFKSFSSADLYYCANKFNWDSGTLVLQWIIDSPKCDTRTAALIFWRGSPEFFKDSTLDTVDDYDKDLFKMLQKIISKFKNNKFKHHKIKFNPKKEGCETEWETDLDIWKLPEGLK